MFVVLLWAAPALAQETLLLDGFVPDDGLDHFFVPFEVSVDTVEVEVRHDDLSEANILDWGLYDPTGWRGWGGGNAEPIVVNGAAASRSYLPGAVLPGTWHVVVGKAKIVETPAPYHIEVELRTAVTLPPQAARTRYEPVAPLSTERRWYAGDLHVHSRESGDASATLDEVADLARERGLDFVVVTDHNTVTHLDWIVDAQARHPSVLLIPGTEFTTYQGHANAFGVRAWVDHKLGQPDVTLQAAAEAYASQGAVFSINHPVLDLGPACIGCAWDLDIPLGAFASMEVATGGWDPTGRLFTPDAIALWDSLVLQGHALAAVGGSDDHRAGTDTGPFASPIGNPTTLVFAENLSESAILDGIRAQRTVVKLQSPADPMADLTIEAGGSAAEVVVTGGGAEVVWIVDGAVVQRDPIPSDPATLALSLGGGEGQVRVEIWEDGAPRAVTSYVAVERATRPPGEEGRRCGCNGTGSPLPGVVLGLLLWVRRKRR